VKVDPYQDKMESRRDGQPNQLDTVQKFFSRFSSDQNEGLRLHSTHLRTPNVRDHRGGTGSLATAAVQRETRAIPIVFATVGDPVASGLVPKFNQPGGNITGFALYEASLGGKWLELLSEIAPGLKRAAIMFGPGTVPISVYMPSFETAARSLKVVPIRAPVYSEGEIETVITALGHEPGGGLVVMPNVFMIAHRVPIIRAAGPKQRTGGLYAI
jgi:putative ABC transport system substrate-binding protein